MAKEIKVALTLDTKNFDKNIVKAKGSMAGFNTGSKKAGAGLLGLTAKFAAVLGPILAVGKGFDQLGKSLGVAAKFEDVQVTLSNIVGSAEGGAAALNKIREVARDLPVSFEELAASAPGLATVSDDIGALEDNIRKTADIAATFGIPFDVAAGQLQRAFSAGAGAADVFREKGVLAAAGFEAGVSYSVEETIAKLDELSEKVKGASEDLNKTFSGAVNQAGDAITDFQAEIGNAFKPEVTALLTNLTEKFRANEDAVLDLAESIGRNALQGIISFARGVATAIDLILSIGRTAKRIGQSIKENFGEQIRAVADGVVRAFALITEGISLVGVGLGRLIAKVTGVNDVEDFFTNINEAAANLRREGLVAIDDTSTALTDFIPVTTARDAINTLVDDFTNGAQKIRDEAQKTSDAAEELGDNLAINLTNGVVSAEEAIKKLTDNLGTVFNLIQDLLGGQTVDFGIAFKEAFDFFSDADRELIQNMDRIKVAIVGIRLAFKDSIITVEEYNSLLRALTQDKVLEDLGLDAEEAARLIRVLNEEFQNQEGIRNFLDAMENATKSLGTDLANAFMEGESAGDSFKKFFRTLVQQIIADTLRLAIIQPILGAILAPFGFGFGSGGNIIKTRALGGPVMKNKPYIVGERGPELFVPNSSGDIIPNNALGSSTTVNYNIQAVDAPSFQSLVARDPEFIYNVSRAGARRTPV